MRCNLFARAIWVVASTCALAGCSSDAVKSGAGGASSSASGGKGSTAGNAGASQGGVGGVGNPANNAGNASCHTGADCADPTKQVCDPKTAVCASGQCTDTAMCGTNQACVQQSSVGESGACYDDCVPYQRACADTTKECVPLYFDDSVGVCLTRGTAAPGATCNGSQVNSGCVAGSLCITETAGTVCREQCDFFGAAPVCATGDRCVMGDVCSPETFDPAPLGGLCALNTQTGTACADDGKALHGICGNRGAGVSCHKVCRENADCGTGATCTAVFQSIPELGVCFENNSCTQGGDVGTTCDACSSAALAAGGCCAAQRKNCDDQAQCNTLLTCLGACMTPECESTCEQQSPNGVVPLNALLGCVYGNGSSFLGACGTLCQ